MSWGELPETAEPDSREAERTKGDPLSQGGKQTSEGRVLGLELSVLNPPKSQVAPGELGVGGSPGPAAGWEAPRGLGVQAVWLGVPQL